jgi:DNA-binding XRE family transcriptional regulator
MLSQPHRARTITEVPNWVSSFGTLLRHYRTLAGLSQEELAEQAGLSRRGISDLERGVRRTPHLTTVRLVAEALGLARAERGVLLAAARQRPQTRSPRPEVARGPRCVCECDCVRSAFTRPVVSHGVHRLH